MPWDVCKNWPARIDARYPWTYIVYIWSPEESKYVIISEDMGKKLRAVLGRRPSLVTFPLPNSHRSITTGMVKIQILSDLYLETPAADDVCEITPIAEYLALLGDIAYTKTSGLIEFEDTWLNLKSSSVCSAITSHTARPTRLADNTSPLSRRRSHSKQVAGSFSSTKHGTIFRQRYLSSAARCSPTPPLLQTILSISDSMGSTTSGIGPRGSTCRSMNRSFAGSTMKFRSSWKSRTAELLSCRTSPRPTMLVRAIDP